MVKWLPFVRAAIRRNGALKLLALLLAVVTYYAIRGATGYEVDYPVPVLVEADPGLAVLSMDPDTLNVRFRGSRDDMQKLDPKRLTAKLRVREENAGDAPRAVRVTARSIEGAGGVSVVSIDPARVDIAFDREVETTFAVARPATVGTPLLGKVELQYQPQVVSVRGPRARIEALKAEGRDQVTTDPVDVDGRVENFTRRVKVHSPGGAWASTITPEEITVQVTIVKKFDVLEWPALPVLAVRRGGETGRVTIDPPVADVKIEGRSDLLERIARGSVWLFVDTLDLGPGGPHELPVRVHVPGAVEAEVSVSPPTVQVTIHAR